MKNEQTIAWQKYEDYLEKQITSPALVNILQSITSMNAPIVNMDEEEEEDEDYVDVIGEEGSKIAAPILPITNQLIEDISMLSSFDCWIGHTNFDITHEIKNKLDKTPGVEVLKILSRYRFFIGVGKLFNFKNVRKDIEKNII